MRKWHCHDSSWRDVLVVWSILYSCGVTSRVHQTRRILYGSFRLPMIYISCKRSTILHCFSHINQSKSADRKFTNSYGIPRRSLIFQASFPWGMTSLRKFPNENLRKSWRRWWVSFFHGNNFAIWHWFSYSVFLLTGKTERNTSQKLRTIYETVTQMDYFSHVKMLVHSYGV